MDQFAARTPGGLPKSNHDIHEMMAEVAEWLKAKGWDDDRTFGDELILIVSELIEALEAFREHGYEEWTSYQPVIRGTKMPKMNNGQVMAMAVAMGVEASTLLINPRREGVGPELAGCLVRILDSCSRHGFMPGIQFRAEMDYNWTRAFRHGGRAL